MFRFLVKLVTFFKSVKRLGKGNYFSGYKRVFKKGYRLRR